MMTKEEQKKYNRRYYQTHRQEVIDAVARRDRLRLYNVSEERYQSLLNEQNGRCAICGEAKRLCVDHCHNTNAVRGLLCRECNGAIGFMYDDPLRLRSAATYLETKALEK